MDPTGTESSGRAEMQLSKTHLLMWEHSPMIQGLVLRKTQEYEAKVLLEFLLKLGVMIFIE